MLHGQQNVKALTSVWKIRRCNCLRNRK